MELLCLILESVCFVLSFACIILFAVGARKLSKAAYNSSRLLDPFKYFMIGVAASAVILFIPVCAIQYQGSVCGPWEILMMSIHKMICLFVVNADFSFITDNLQDMVWWLRLLYTAYAAFLYVLAPVLTFGLVLSFFKNISAYIWYILRRRKEVYIFSELNEKSLLLAQNLKKNDSSREIVFTDVRNDEDTHTSELYEKARSIRAICFKRDILTVDFTSWHSKSKLCFFTINEDPSKNIRQGLALIASLKTRENTHLYIFSSELEAELLLTDAFQKEGASSVGIKVRRVKEVQSLINRNLYEHGYEKIFCSAVDDGSTVKKINALVVGMGQHGTEMTKALAWFCQMDGYAVTVNSIDADPVAEDKFISLCPELMDDGHNGKFDIPGEARYMIEIHSGMDVNTKRFNDLVANLPQTTYVMVCLGNDALNIATAVKLRRLFAQKGWHPVIQAVVYDPEKKNALTGITNFRGQAYDIDFIGDMETSYSENVILKSDLEAVALERHMKWVDKTSKEKRIAGENAFWQYDYNYTSSVASAIHYRAKQLCRIPGIDKKPESRSQDELWALRRLEHCRWDAYMRSEGYVFSGNSKDKATRNDLAKMHHCLAPFDQLLPNEQEKDDD